MIRFDLNSIKDALSKEYEELGNTEDLFETDSDFVLNAEEDLDTELSLNDELETDDSEISPLAPVFRSSASSAIASSASSSNVNFTSSIAKSFLYCFTAAHAIAAGGYNAPPMA
jgi:hypothetical protein